MKKKSLLAFVHIEKSAGTSIIHLLRHNYFLRYLDVRPLAHRDRIFKAEDLLRYMAIAPWLKVVGGHSVVPWSDLESISDVRYIALLRNPEKRYISQYRYWNSHLGKGISVEEYLSREGPRNIQVKKLAGEENLDKAINVIGEKFVCIGVVEHFERFLLNLQDKERSFHALHIVQNVNKTNSASADRLVEQYGDDIRENNWLDMQLYDYVLKHIEERVSASLDARQAMPCMKRSPRLMADYLFRKLYVEPVTGWIRQKNGLEKKGSY